MSPKRGVAAKDATSVWPAVTVNVSGLA